MDFALTAGLCTLGGAVGMIGSCMITTRALGGAPPPIRRLPVALLGAGVGYALTFLTLAKIDEHLDLNVNSGFDKVQTLKNTECAKDITVGDNSTIDIDCAKSGREGSVRNIKTGNNSPVVIRQ